MAKTVVTRDVLVLEDADAVAEMAAELVVAVAAASVEEHGRFSIALAGGSTPIALYERLAAPERIAALPWAESLALFGDERCVPPDDPDSNFGAAHRALLAHVAIPDGNVLRMPGEEPHPARAAQAYDDVLRRRFPGVDVPTLDLVLLGVGEDGHTASLFPGTEALEERERWCVANFVPERGVWRLTLTLPVFNAARHVVFLATGSNKASIVAEAFGGKPRPKDAPPYPCQRVLPSEGSLQVLVDRLAAAELTEP